MNAAEEIGGGFVIACGNRTKLFEFGKKVLNRMSGLVQLFIKDSGCLSLHWLCWE